MYTTVGGDFNASGKYLWLSDKDENKTFTLDDVKDTSKALIFNLKHFGYFRDRFYVLNFLARAKRNILARL